MKQERTGLRVCQIVALCLMAPCLLALVIFWVAIIGMFSDGFPRTWEPEYISRVQSPDGEWEAVVYTLDCGALAATRINVSIIEAGDSDPEEFGNVYMSRCTGWPLKCFWRSNSKLVIARPDEPDAKARPCPTWNGITITYEFLE